VITIVSIFDPEPSIHAEIRDQRCFTDNGSIYLTIAGTLPPYQCSLTTYPFTSGLQYDNLGPATYTMSIRDKNACEWDTSFVVQPYPKEVVTLAVDSINPVCTTLNSGALSIQVQGDQAPYWLGFRNTTYASGSLIDELNAGSYSLPVIDKNGCVVDTAHAQLVLEVKPECNIIYLPNAFTPNGDGTNDDFRILHGSPYLTALSLRVYNRYGGVIFASSDIQKGWDGTYNGEKMPGGVYVWEVEYTDLEKTTRRARGTVMLLR
jgi:gliding motility-associated-like protein